MDRRKVSSLGRLAARYASHQARRLTGRVRHGGLQQFMRIYRRDHLTGVPGSARRVFPELLPCTGCGLCAFAVAPVGASDPRRLTAQLGRSFPDFPDAVADARRLSISSLTQASAICPFAIPLPDARHLIEGSLQLAE